MNSQFVIDPSACISCGKCIRECGHHDSSIQDGGHIDPGNPRCIKCYHCYTICPGHAIRLAEPAKAPAFDVSSMQAVTQESLSAFLAYRRSIRSFQKKTVDDAVVEMLVDRARYIPSGGNSHSYEFTVLKSEDVKSQIYAELKSIYQKRSLLLNNPLLRNAAKPFVNKQMRGFLRDRNYGRRMKDLIARIDKGDDPFFYHAPVIIVIHSKAQIPTPKEDCVLAGYNICLIAQTLGLGTCYVTLGQNAFNASKRCKKILGMTPQDNVNAVVVLGHPAVHHERLALKPEKQIHWR